MDTEKPFQIDSSFKHPKQKFKYRVNSGIRKFRHQVNSDIHLQTEKIQMRRLFMSRLIKVFTVSLCFVSCFFIPIIRICNKQGRCPNLADCPNLPDFTLVIILRLKIVYLVLCISLFAGLVTKFMNKNNDGLRAACKRCGYGRYNGTT